MRAILRAQKFYHRTIEKMVIYCIRYLSINTIFSDVSILKPVDCPVTQPRQRPFLHIWVFLSASERAQMDAECANCECEVIVIGRGLQSHYYLYLAFGHCSVHPCKFAITPSRCRVVGHVCAARWPLRSSEVIPCRWFPAGWARSAQRVRGKGRRARSSAVAATASPGWIWTARPCCKRGPTLS